MVRISKKNQKLIDDAVKDVRKPKEKKEKKKRAPAGTRIPDNVWVDDEQQGCVFILQGKVLGVDIDKETGIIKTVRMAYGEWKTHNDTNTLEDNKRKENKETNKTKENTRRNTDKKV